MAYLLHLGNVTNNALLDCKQLRFFARSGQHIHTVTSLCVVKKVFLKFFQPEKRQQNEASWSEVQKWTAFFGGESGFRGQQHHSLGITTGLVCMLSLFITNSYPTSLQRLVVTLYRSPAREITEGPFLFVRTDRSDHSHPNENFTFIQNYSVRHILNSMQEGNGFQLKLLVKAYFMVK